jgi:hypothetical protein
MRGYYASEDIMNIYLNVQLFMNLPNLRADCAPRLLPVVVSFAGRTKKLNLYGLIHNCTPAKCHGASK